MPREVEVVEGAGDAAEQEERARGDRRRAPACARLDEAHPREDEARAPPWRRPRRSPRPRGGPPTSASTPSPRGACARRRRSPAPYIRPIAVAAPVNMQHERAASSSRRAAAPATGRAASARATARARRRARSARRGRGRRTRSPGGRTRTPRPSPSFWWIEKHLAGERAGDDQQQRAEEDVDAEALEARLAPADDRREEEPGRQERRRDPEDRRSGCARCGVRRRAGSRPSGMPKNDWPSTV